MTSPTIYDFDWDAAKAAANVAKHQVHFGQAMAVFRDPLALTLYDEAHSQYEERWITIGLDAEGFLLLVVHTFQYTTPINVLIRMISAREATRRERADYENEPR